MPKREPMRHLPSEPLTPRQREAANLTRARPPLRRVGSADPTPEAPARVSNQLAEALVQQGPPPRPSTDFDIFYSYVIRGETTSEHAVSCRSLGVASESTLRKRLKCGGNVPVLLRRFRNVFSAEMENDLATQVRNLDDRFYGITKQNLQIVAYIFAELIILNILSIKKVKWLGKTGSMDFATGMDETGLSTVPNELPKIWTTKGKKLVGEVSAGKSGQLATARMNEDLYINAPPGTLKLISDSGFINTDLFYQWMKHFKNYSKPSAEHPILLILDNHSSHREFCRDNHIDLLSLSPHSSRKMQTLDIGFLCPLKRTYSTGCDNWMVSNAGNAITQKQVAGSFSAADKTTNREKAQNSFRRAVTDICLGEFTVNVLDAASVEKPPQPGCVEDTSKHVLASQPGCSTDVNVQNELIETVKCILDERIENELEGSLFVSVQVDEILDVSFSETKVELDSVFILHCRMCELKKPGSLYADAEMYIDIAATAAIVSIGRGYSQLTEFLAAINCPPISFKFYKKMENDLADVTHKTPWKDMQNAVNEEEQLAIKPGEIDGDGKAWIDLKTIATEKNCKIKMAKVKRATLSKYDFNVKIQTSFSDLKDKSKNFKIKNGFNPRPAYTDEEPVPKLK
ncbi:hypothetical protein ILUMI_07822 [Ignelater luminosus]|uniref:DDE-1 domain-containing protein n=1 Tax=Ignelater luminosus TaxID=2038154 RepID=A0A8K0D5N9_IGNLU|nr:hypothetical protein ILUMI_07822 [Ignelater luminosus]